MRIVGILLIFTIIIFGATFAILNAAPVDIHYYFNTKTLPLSLLLVIAFSLGATLGLFFGMSLYLQLRFEMRKLRQRARTAEAEVANLRAIPIQDKR